MANKEVFNTQAGRRFEPAVSQRVLEALPETDTLNNAAAPAYSFRAEHNLKQIAMTGCLNGTAYTTPESQLEAVKELCAQLTPRAIAEIAISARKEGYMKDMPALLTAILSTRSPEVFRETFPQVIDDGKMLRNFVQIMRSGQAGRKSLGRLPKQMINEWLESRSDESIFRQSTGNNPSMRDIIRMVHPAPNTESRRALYGYLLGKEHRRENLPELVKHYEDFKSGRRLDVPNLPFERLTSTELGSKQWAAIAHSASWQTVRMNLNTFARHGVFNEPGMSRIIADKLRDPEAIAKAKVFPYQLLVAYRKVNEDVPYEVKDALQDAMEVAIRGLPRFPGKVYVFADVSGSMDSPVTGTRAGATTAVRCIDVAGLVGAAVLRTNPGSEVIPFEHSVVSHLAINSRDSVMTNADKLSSVGGGGTNCSAPMRLLNERKARGDLVIYVSDNESWVDSIAKRAREAEALRTSSANRYGYSGYSGYSGYTGYETQESKATETMRQWDEFKKRNPNAKLVCIDISPNGTTQAATRSDILNVGGFSDKVFETIAKFALGKMEAGDWAPKSYEEEEVS